MDLLIVPVPLFNKEIGVEAYYFRYRKGNDIIADSRSSGLLDGAMLSPALEMLDLVGLDPFTAGRPLIVPISHYMLLANLQDQCKQPPDKIVFLLDGGVPVDETTVKAVRRLCDKGFRFGIQKIANAKVYAPILELCDYIFYDHRLHDSPEQVQLRRDIRSNHRYLKSVFTHIGTMEQFEELCRREKGLYEGRFYRMPVTKGDNKVSPLQHNMLNLLNMIRDEYIDFMSVANVIRCDAALSISLLRFINSPAVGLRNPVQNIHQAVTILGQDQVRKWATSAVSKLLGTDKPNEITKLSLVRARFAEALAPLFGMKAESEALYLMGLFSVLDVILEMPMKDALQVVRVSDAIYNALVYQEGRYAPVYQFMQQYERADWNALSRTMIVKDLATEDTYSAYVQSLLWYRDLLRENDVPLSSGPEADAGEENPREPEPDQAAEPEQEPEEKSVAKPKEEKLSEEEPDAKPRKDEAPKKKPATPPDPGSVEIVLSEASWEAREETEEDPASEPANP